MAEEELEMGFSLSAWRLVQGWANDGLIMGYVV